MGYTITIGELEVVQSPDDGLDCKCIRFYAEGVRHDDAPAFGDPTDHTNSRWPSYSVWSDFAKMVGLYDVLFCDGTLLGGHPGVRLVTPALSAAVAEALSKFQAAHPGMKPEYDVTDEASNLASLIWLDYWMRWARENCKVPVMVNS